jgi:nitrogen regulatory protein PII
MSKKNKIMCLVSTENGDMVGEVINQYEEVGGADDGAIFAVISLENGQLITVKIQEYIEQ